MDPELAMTKPNFQSQPTDDLIQKTLEILVRDYYNRGPEGWLKFMRDELRYRPDPCLEPVIADVASFFDTSCRSSHGVGKTAGGGCLMLTAMAMVPELVALQLSPTWTQVIEVFWNEARIWHGRSNILAALFQIAEKTPRLWSRLSPETWYARGLSSSQQGNVEGRHNRNLLLIVDEAKAVEDRIIEGVQGALTSAVPGAKVWRAYFSTPSTPGGRFTLFYKTFTKHKGRWKNHHISAFDSPRVSQRWIDQMIADWGVDSQIVQARVFGNFPEGGDDILIPLQAAEAFYRTDVEPTGLVSLGVDVARFGLDESVISVMQGSVLREVKPFDKKDTVFVARQVIEYAERLDARVIVIDDIGVGGGVTDQVANHFDEKKHVFVLPFVASAKSSEPDKFVALGDEVWWQFAKDLKESRIASLVQDERLEGELTSYKVQYPGNRIRVVWPDRKKDRLSSDSHSPDRGDSVIMAWWGSRMLSGALTATLPGETEDFDEDETGIPESRGLMDRKF